MEDVARVMAGTARRVMRLVEFRRQCAGLDDDAAEEDPLLATLMADSIHSLIATSAEAGQRWRRLGDRVEPADEDVAEEPPPRCVREGGMSLHADVAVPARDASGSSACAATSPGRRSRSIDSRPSPMDAWPIA
jgi:hypothetical protein